MPQPSTPLATLRPDIAGSVMEFDLSASREGFLGNRLFPVLEVGEQSGSFGVIPAEELLQEHDTNRTNRGTYNRIEGEFDDIAYATRETGLEERVDRREAKIYRNYFDAEVVAGARAQDAVKRAYETRVLAKTINNNSLANNAVGTAWNASSGATPIADVTAEMISFNDTSGMVPNVLVIPWVRYQALKNNDEIIERIKYAGYQDPSRAATNLQALAQAFGIEEVWVHGGQTNTGGNGGALALNRMWPVNKALLARVARTNDIKEPCLGRTFHWGEDGSQMGGVFETYYSEEARSDVVRQRMDTDEVVIYSALGRVITGI